MADERHRDGGRQALRLFALLLLAACTSSAPATPSPSLTAGSAAAPSAPGSAPSPASSITPSAAPSVAAALPTRQPGFRLPKPDDQTAWGQELLDLDDKGRRSKESALRLFALAYGPLPGVEVTPDGEPIRSGTSAIRAVREHWDALSPEQRTAIEAYLAPRPEDVVIPIEPVAAGSSARSTDIRFAISWDDRQQLQADLRAAAIDVRAWIAGNMGGDIPGPVDLVLAGQGDPKVWGDENPRYGASGAYSGCSIRIFDLAIAGGSGVLLSTLAHEVFHCFQDAAYRTAARSNAAPRWVMEGGARWVGNTYAGVFLEPDRAWDRWLETPAMPLYQRVYDAVGFWSLLDETGSSPWQVFPAVFTVDGHSASFRATGAAANESLMNSWASSVLREPNRGQDWDMDGPAITTAEATPIVVQVARGQTKPFSADPYAGHLVAVFVQADLLMVSAKGHARISDEKTDWARFPQAFCVRESGCPPCPPGEGEMPQTLPLLFASVLAITGGVDGTTGTMSALNIEDICKKKPTPTPRRAVWVKADRPAQEPMVAGRVIELVACEGAIGPWKGFMAVGGLQVDTFSVPFVPLDVAFTVTGDGVPAKTSTGGVIPTPVFDLTVAYDLTFVVNGNTMSIDGQGRGQNNMFGVGGPIEHHDLPIEPAPPEKCP